MKTFFSFSLAWLLTFPLIEQYSEAANGDPTEASGIVRLNDDLLIVADADPGAYYRLSLNGRAGPVFPLDDPTLSRVAWPAASLAVDLESIDVLADGRVVLLSERLRALITEQGIVTQYDDALAEIGERGLEGLAIRQLPDRSSRVAVLWEGGYLRASDLQHQFFPIVGNRSFRPIAVVHDVSRGALGERHRMKRTRPEDIIELKVPEPPGTEPSAQRFRAPDLVWHSRNGRDWEFIVLLNSMSAEPEEYRHLWLQRFALDGTPHGEPEDIDKRVPQHLRELNWEGLSWFEDGVSVVLIDDTGAKRRTGPPTAYVMTLPADWRRTADSNSRDP
jgi:hypothetical protein